MVLSISSRTADRVVGPGDVLRVDVGVDLLACGDAHFKVEVLFALQMAHSLMLAMCLNKSHSRVHLKSWYRCIH